MNANSQNNSLLLVEDSASTAIVYQSYLEQRFEVTIAHNGRSALEHFHRHTFAAVILDVQLPDISGLDILKTIRRDNQDIPVIIITAHGSVDTALEAMRIGATDFISKPFDKARIEVTLNNSLKGKQLSEMVHSYEKSLPRDRLHNMLGSCLPMQTVYNIIESAAHSKATVFITGESGTGKELCAEAIHKTSQRANQEFVALNCAAIPHDLLESEIFGHVKGAFTGAAAARQGAAAIADKGTLFLDEIGEMPLDLQSKLLRFIQTGSYSPVGSSKEIEVDVRFVCATNRDPLEEVRQGRFREDLYYRLHVIPIHMPPLRSRGQDCLQIARAMLTEYSNDENKSFLGFSSEVEQIFLSYPWPGNVRELSNVVRNTVVLNDAQEVSADLLPPPVNQHQVNAQSETNAPAQSNHHAQSSTMPQVHSTNSAPSNYNMPNQRSSFQSQPNSPTPQSEQTHSSVQMPHAPQDIEPLWLSEKKIIERAIEICQGNIPKAAAFLDISASTIYRKKQQWEQKVMV